MKPLIIFASAAVAMMPATTFAASVKAPAYVAQAGASDMFEKQSSQLVANSQNQQVAQFAQMMIQDHTKSTNDVVAAAQADGVTPAPPKLMPKQQAMLSQLEKAEGSKRDALYIKQQVAAHQQALTLHQGYAKGGDKTNLKQTAATIAPIVEHHLQEAKSLKAS